MRNNTTLLLHCFNIFVTSLLHREDKNMSIKVALAGVGNCTSALVQGIE
jgi:hypothetical protein